MNKLFKTLILILYTSAIFIVALLIIKSTNKGANFEKYTSKSYDDNIAVVTQVIEKRSSKEETDTDYEKSEYDIHLFIKKLSNFTDMDETTIKNVILSLGNLSKNTDTIKFNYYMNVSFTNLICMLIPSERVKIPTKLAVNEVKS